MSEWSEAKEFTSKLQRLPSLPLNTGQEMNAKHLKQEYILPYIHACTAFSTKRNYFVLKTLYQRVFLTDLWTIQFNHNKSFTKSICICTNSTSCFKGKIRPFIKPIHHHSNMPSLLCPSTIENRCIIKHTKRQRNVESTGSHFNFNAEQHYMSLQ